MDESLGSVGVDDYDFQWTMGEHGASFQAIDECLYVYRDHRSSFRLTTDLPLSHHKRGSCESTRSPAAIDEAVACAERGYLRQCLFRNRFERRLKPWPRRAAGWRERYD